MAQVYRKHFIPLESNPEVFSDLLHDLGVPTLSFVDVLSLDDPELLLLVPRPAYALILVFPTSEAYEEEKRVEEQSRPDYAGRGNDEDVIWFKQTINNACGLYGILHAACNGSARSFIAPSTLLSRLLDECIPLAPEDRALRLEESKDLENVYAKAATGGDSAVPVNAEDEVDFHYICFTRSHKNGRLYEMDGDKKGPVDLGVRLREDEDLLSETVLEVVRGFMQRERGENLNFSLMALVRSEE